jgi:hypothetical protein
LCEEEKLYEHTVGLQEDSAGSCHRHHYLSPVPKTRKYHWQLEVLASHSGGLSSIPGYVKFVVDKVELG